MDYQKHYDSLITRAKERGTQKRNLSYYTEKHRILPGCLGGKYTKENVALLTPEEHYVAHQLLVKMYPDNEKLVYALNKMTQGRVSNKRYGWIKRRWSEVCMKRTGEKNGSYGKSWYYNPETGEASKFAEPPDGWVKGKKPKPKNTSCCVCGKDTAKRLANFCNEHRNTNSVRKVTEQEIAKALENSSSIREGLEKLEIAAKGKNYQKAKQVIIDFEINLPLKSGRPRKH